MVVIYNNIEILVTDANVLRVGRVITSLRYKNCGSIITPTRLAQKERRDPTQLHDGLVYVSVKILILF